MSETKKVELSYEAHALLNQLRQPGRLMTVVYQEKKASDIVELREKGLLKLAGDGTSELLTLVLTDLGRTCEVEELPREEE